MRGAIRIRQMYTEEGQKEEVFCKILPNTEFVLCGEHFIYHDCKYAKNGKIYVYKEDWEKENEVFKVFKSAKDFKRNAWKVIYNENIPHLARPIEIYNSELIVMDTDWSKLRKEEEKDTTKRRLQIYSKIHE